MASRWARAIAGRAVLFAGAWLALTRGDTSAWPLAALAVIAAVAASMAVMPPAGTPVRWRRTPGFLAFFLWQALLGGVDVARRALDPRLPIRPGFLRHASGLPHGAARLLLAWTVSLLPGTVSVELTPDGLEVHALDVGSGADERLAELEARIAVLFGAEDR